MLSEVIGQGKGLKVQSAFKPDGPPGLVRSLSPPSWMGCYFIVGLPPGLSSACSGERYYK